MRKVLLVFAAVALALGPSGVAHADSSDGGSRCQLPKVNMQYGVHQFAVAVSLPASGCASREHTQFELDTTVTRMDNNWSHDVTDRSTMCGPFRSAADAEPGYPVGQYSCDLSVTVDHPSVETAEYRVEVTYPGATGDRTGTQRSNRPRLSAGVAEGVSVEGDRVNFWSGRRPAWLRPLGFP